MWLAKWSHLQSGVKWGQSHQTKLVSCRLLVAQCHIHMKRRRRKVFKKMFFLNATPCSFSLHTHSSNTFHLLFFMIQIRNRILFMSLAMKDIVKCLHEPDTSKPCLQACLLCRVAFCEIYALSRRRGSKYFCPAGFYNQVLLFLALDPCYHPAEEKKKINLITLMNWTT